MKLKKIYEEVVKKGIDADPRSTKEISNLLKARKQSCAKQDKKNKELVDLDSLTNPFADTRILTGDSSAEINSVIAGIEFIQGNDLVIAVACFCNSNLIFCLFWHLDNRASGGFANQMCFAAAGAIVIIAFELQAGLAPV